MTIHRIDASQPHAFWDNRHPPRARIASGDTVIFETRDASAGQIRADSTSRDLYGVSFSPIRPLSGPVYVEGAEPGDVLEVEVLGLEHHGWGWGAVLPGTGLLSRDFSEPYLHHYRIEGSTCIFNDAIAIPFRPFCGVMGLAPDRPGRFDTVPPDAAGDLPTRRPLGPGSRATFPVRARGALFSCGDGHAARAAGEVSGTGVEAPLTALLRFHLHKPDTAAALEREAPATDRGPAPEARPFSTTAVGPDLYRNAQNAVRDMIDHLSRTHGLSRPEAYCLCGAAVDLEIETGDAETRVAVARLPRGIFSKRVAA